MKYLKLTTAMLAVFSLSACLGSGDKKVVEAPVEEPVVEEPVVEQATYIEKSNTVNGLNNAINIGTNLDVDDDNYLALNNYNLPNTGSANYTGVMDLDLKLDSPAASALLGDFDMDVDFAALEVSGSAGNFSNSLDEVWSGDLVVDGTIAGGFDIDVDGTLSNPDGLDTIIAMQVTSLSLYGSGAPGAQTPEYVEGDVKGLATTGVEAPVGIDGGFIGQVTN